MIGPLKKDVAEGLMRLAERERKKRTEVLERFKRHWPSHDLESVFIQDPEHGGRYKVHVYRCTKCGVCLDDRGLVRFEKKENGEKLFRRSKDCDLEIVKQVQES